MSKLKNFKGFTDKYKEILDLSQSQINDIDDVEYNLYKDRHWNYSPDRNDFTSNYAKRIKQILTQEQIATLEDHKQEQQAKAKDRKNDKYQKTLDEQAHRLKSLNLSAEQLQAYVEIKCSWHRITRDKIKKSKPADFLKPGSIIQRINEEDIYPIFNESQLAKYKKIDSDELKRRKEWGDKWRKEKDREIYERKCGLNLSDAQADELFNDNFYERPFDENGEILSDFEYRDLELDRIKRILTPEQFQQYLPFHESQLNSIIESLTKTNNGHHLNQLNRTKKHLSFYLENVLPRLVESRNRIEPKLNQNQKGLINDIRNKYHKRLDSFKEKFVEQQTRYSKGHCPNELEELLLRNQLDRISVMTLYLQNIESTKELMTEEIVKLVSQEYQDLEEVFEMFKNFKVEVFESTGGKYAAGFKSRITLKEGNEHLQYIGLLLIHPDLKANLDLVKIR